MYHPLQSISYPGGLNILQQIDQTDTYVSERRTAGVHYPFTSCASWQLANWLSSTSLSQSEINGFLQLDYVSHSFQLCLEICLILYQVRQNWPTFTSAQDVRNRIEELPHVPGWSHHDITIPNFQTKEPMTLYWRDGLEVVKHLFTNPIFATCIEMNPYKLLEVETGLCIYGEFMSAEYAWNYQVCTLQPFFRLGSHKDVGIYSRRPYHGWHHRCL